MVNTCINKIIINWLLLRNTGITYELLDELH